MSSHHEEAHVGDQGAIRDPSSMKRNTKIDDTKGKGFLAQCSKEQHLLELLGSPRVGTIEDSERRMETTTLQWLPIRHPVDIVHAMTQLAKTVCQSIGWNKVASHLVPVVQISSLDLIQQLGLVL